MCASCGVPLNVDIDTLTVLQGLEILCDCLGFDVISADLVEVLALAIALSRRRCERRIRQSLLCESREDVAWILDVTVDQCNALAAAAADAALLFKQRGMQFCFLGVA